MRVQFGHYRWQNDLGVDSETVKAIKVTVADPGSKGKRQILDAMNSNISIQAGHSIPHPFKPVDSTRSNVTANIAALMGPDHLRYWCRSWWFVGPQHGRKLVRETCFEAPGIRSLRDVSKRGMFPEPLNSKAGRFGVRKVTREIVHQLQHILVTCDFSKSYWTIWTWIRCRDTSWPFVTTFAKGFGVSSPTGFQESTMSWWPPTQVADVKPTSSVACKPHVCMHT